MSDIKWLFDKPEDHDYPAARSYLNLIYNDKRAGQCVAALKSRRTPVAPVQIQGHFSRRAPASAR